MVVKIYSNSSHVILLQLILSIILFIGLFNDDFFFAGMILFTKIIIYVLMFLEK